VGDFSQDDNVPSNIGEDRQDIADLQGDLQQLAGDGQPAPAGATAAITRSQRSIRHVLAAVNGDIEQLNADVAEAFSMANAMAKIPSTSTTNGSSSGTCRGNGPGKLPRPIKHIR
jgi:hypothetical protein